MLTVLHMLLRLQETASAARTVEDEAFVYVGAGASKPSKCVDESSISPFGKGGFKTDISSRGYDRRKVQLQKVGQALGHQRDIPGRFKIPSVSLQPRPLD